MKLLERTKHAPEQPPELLEHDVLEHIEIPDDLSGLVEATSIGERKAEPRRAATMVRWLRWVPVFLLAIAGVVAAAVLLNDTGGEEFVVPTVDAPDFATEGPGSNSLFAPWLTQTQVPWPTAHEGPGGHTLNMVAMPLALQVTPPQIEFSWETHGPGSTSIGSMATPSAVWSWETHGPGSNSLFAPWLTQGQVPWSSPHEGPGGHSLNMIDV